MAEIFLLVVFPTLMAFAAASDLLTMTIPNKLSLALIAAFAVLALAGGLPASIILLHLGAGALVLALAFLFFSLGWIGGGDAKLAAATALWLGFGTLPDYLAVAAIGGGLLSVTILLFRRWPLPGFALGWTWLTRIHDSRAGVPYGIALAMAALVVYPQSEIWAASLAP